MHALPIRQRKIEGLRSRSTAEHCIVQALADYFFALRHSGAIEEGILYDWDRPFAELSEEWHIFDSLPDGIAERAAMKLCFAEEDTTLPQALERIQAFSQTIVCEFA